MNIDNEDIIQLNDDSEKDGIKEKKKEEKAQEIKAITIEQVWDYVEEAEKIITTFVKEQFGEDALNRVSDALNNLEIGIDNDPKNAKSCSAYYVISKKTVMLTEKSCKENNRNIQLIYTIIHECAHLFSYSLSKGTVNAVVEEAMADLFAEMSINNYIQKGNKINCLSNKDNEILSKNNGYYYRNSYISEGEFTRGIMYAIKTKNRDMEAFKEYFFGSKEKFVDICEETLGSDLRDILIKDLAKVQNYQGVEDNTELYLPPASKKLRNILQNFFNFPLDETAIKQHKNGEESALYSVDGNLMRAICFENKLKYEWLQKIDFKNLNESNMQEIFSNLNIEDIRELSEKANGKIIEISREWGHSNFIKLLIRGWYEANKENSSNFEEIMSLTEYIPFDIFQEIMKDKEITDISSIMHFIAQYHVIYDEKSYSSILELLNQKVGNDFDKIQFDKHEKNRENTMIGLDGHLLKFLSELNLPSESLQKILYIYSNPLTQIKSDNILDIIDILGKIDYSTLSEDDLGKLFNLQINIVEFVEKNNDIVLLKKIEQLPEGAIPSFLMKQLKTLDKSEGLSSEEDIRDNLFENDEGENNISDSQELIEDAVSVTVPSTRKSQINYQVLQIEENQNPKEQQNGRDSVK